MNLSKKVFIYFDTNMIECRHSGKGLYLSQFTVKNTYFQVEELVKSLGVADNVEICIPDVVWCEVQEHLVRHFNSEMDSMKSKIESYRKSFGDLVEISYSFRDKDIENEYEQYAKQIADDFLDNPRVSARIIQCPKDEKTIQEIIGQAIRSIKPFTAAKANGKEYTDAGFKDALILCTIINHTGTDLGIIVSEDDDLTAAVNNYENLELCKDINAVKRALEKAFNIVSLDTVAATLKNDEYLMKRILSETGFAETDAVQFSEFISCDGDEDDLDNAHVVFEAYINGGKYTFDVLFNVNVHELIEATCELSYESEE